MTLFTFVRLTAQLQPLCIVAARLHAREKRPELSLQRDVQQLRQLNGV